MKKMKLSLIACLLLMMLLCSITLAGSYSLMRAPAPGVYTNNVGGVGKVMQIEAYDSTVADGTVTLYKTVPGSSTSNLEYTVTCSSGKAVVALTSTNTFYLAGGDILTRSGTATNGTVRLILD